MMRPEHRGERLVLADGLRSYELWDATFEPMSAQERRAAQQLLALRVIDALAHRSEQADALGRLLSQASIGPAREEWSSTLLKEQIELGRIGIRARSSLPLPGGLGERDEPEPLDHAEPLLAPRWIEIHVHDRDGAPLAGLSYRLELPSGETEHGRLGDDAMVRSDEITSSGTCTLVLEGLPDHPRPRERGVMPAADQETSITYRHAGAVSLTAERIHRIVVEPPPPQPALSFRGAMFGRGSAFPTSAVAPLLRWAQEWADEPGNEGQGLGVFAHADKSGAEQANKELSDRRAQAVFALLTGDLPAFRQVAEQDEWGTTEDQAMLRALGCNPGPIDGMEGPMTAAAIRLFRREYGLDTFHRDVRPRAHGDLPDTSTLDPVTRDALIDAYHAEFSVAVPAERFWGPGHMGCGELNPFSRKASIVRDRRVTLVQYGEARPREIDFPCRRGDAGACAIEEDGSHRRCRFYRDNVLDDSLDEPFPFWDFEWLRTPKGLASLSALTTLPDVDDLDFIVELQHGPAVPEDSDHGAPPAARGLRLGRVRGRVRRGVAHAIWQPPAHYDPFDASRWFEYVPEEESRRLILPPFQPPVFSIEGETEDGVVWGVAGPPGKELRHVQIEGDASGPATAIRNDGAFLWIDDLSRLPELAEGHRIVAIFRPGTRFEVEEGGS